MNERRRLVLEASQGNLDAATELLRFIEDQPLRIGINLPTDDIDVGDWFRVIAIEGTEFSHTVMLERQKRD